MNKYLFGVLFSLALFATIAHPYHWDYTQTGKDWPDLCQTGKMQSPIDLSPPYYTSPVPLQLSYTNLIDKAELKRNQAMLETEINTGHSIQVNGDAGYFMYGNHRFDVTQFHFHAPSDHTVNGKHFPLELHIVHKNRLGNTAVIAILFKKSKKESHFIKQLEEGGFPKPGETKKVQLPIGLNYFDSPSAGYLIYDGSFTTPPCTEGVQWFVLTDFFPISQKQIDNWPKFDDAPNGTYRKTQPLNHRVVRSF